MRAGQPSHTAQRVAAQRLTFDRIHVPYGSPQADELLAQDVVAGLAGPVGGPLTRYLRARTRFFDSAVVTALDRGVTQVVVAGAGYDGRSLRYALPGVTWYEVDHPATQADKRARLDRLGIDTRRVVFVAADFNDGGLAVALREAGHDPGVPSLVLCEGVAVYLDDRVLESLLAELREACAPGSRLAISVSITATSDDYDRRRQDFAETVAALGEPARSELTATGMELLFDRTGWRSVPAGVVEARLAGFVVAEPV